MANFKRYLCFLLCIIMILSNSMFSFASNGIKDNASGQTNTSSAATTKGNGTFKIPANIGLRFTITDNQGKIVSVVNGSKGSLDVLNDGAYKIYQSNSGSMFYLKGAATDGSATGILSITKTKFIELINGGPNMNPLPDWVESDESLHGEDVRKWIMDNAKYIYNPSINSNAGGGSSSSGTITAGSGGSGSGSSNTYVDKTDYYQTLYVYINGVPDPNAYKTQAQYNTRLDSWYNNRCSVLETHLKNGHITASQYATLLKRANDNKEACLMEARMVLASNFINNMFSITSYATSETPTGRPNVDSKEDGWAWEIINLYDENKNYIFQLSGASKTESEYLSGGKRPSDVFLENDYRLVVENIIVGRPQNYVNGAPGASYPVYVLGTAHNWAIFGVTKWKPWGGNDSFGNHQRYLTRMLPRGLVTVNNWLKDENGDPNDPNNLVLGAPVDDEQWKISEMDARYKTGFGTHVYSPGDIGGTSVIETVPNMINTYDITTNPKKDAPSEPSTNKQDPEDYGSKALTFNIDKHYRYKDVVTGKITEISYFTTVNAPHTISITDEVDKTGYKLKDWFTSTDGWLPPSNGNPKDYNWETVVKGQHNNGKYSGTEETLLVVEPTDSDNVLHLLYEYEGLPSGSVINTYDITTNPSDPAPSEPSSNKDPESDYGSNSLKFSIDKHYRYKDSSTGEVEERHYFTTVNAPHTVIISDEVDKTGYKLKDWFTSTDGWLPPSNDNPKDYPWETVVKGRHKNGQYSGSSAQTLVVKPTDPDNVLHLLYEKVPDKDLNLVKVYLSEDSNGNFKYFSKDGPDLITRVTNYTADKGDAFQYVESVLSTSTPDSSYLNDIKDLDGASSIPHPSGSLTNSLSYSVASNIKTIYLYYVKSDAQIKLYSNELTNTFGLVDLVGSRKAFAIYDYAPILELDEDDAPDACDGNHTQDYDCGSCHGGHGDKNNDGFEDDCGSCHGCTDYYSCEQADAYLSDSSWVVAVKNSYQYEKNTSFIKDYTYKTAKKTSYATKEFTAYSGYDEDESTPHSITLSDGSLQELCRSLEYLKNHTSAKPKDDYTLYRDKSKDIITLYPGKNSASLKDTLKEIGISSEGYSPRGTRLESEMISDDFFMNTFKTDFEYTSARDKSLEWTWPNEECELDNTGTYSTIVATSPDDADNYYNSSIPNVKTYYYVGEANNGLSDGVDSRDSSFKKFSKLKFYTNSSSELKFYPYSLMIYRDFGKHESSSTYNAAKSAGNYDYSGIFKDGIHDVYVTSENLSTMKVFNAIQTGVYKKKEINVNLTSTQWSTHARSHKFLEDNGISDKNSVLPGGAIQDLDMGSKGDTRVAVRVYQSCLPDAQVSKVQSGFNTSVSQVLSTTESLKNEIKSVLEGYGLVQWGTEGVKTKMEDVRDDGEELHENTSIDFVIGNGGKTSSDSKYYLRHDGSGSSRANFDVLSSNIDSQYLYTIKSDVYGNVELYRKDIKANGSDTLIARINMKQDASDMRSKSNEIATLDDCTRLITNYIDAIDRNKGNDNEYAYSNVAKYNEAFDGVSVLVTNYSFDIGFSDNSGHRTNVLDTLLVGKASSKSDLYNFEEDSNVRSSVYTTNLISSTSTVKEEGYLGTLKGFGVMPDIKIYLNNIYELGYTKTFYIPNATVSDLN